MEASIFFIKWNKTFLPFRPHHLIDCTVGVFAWAMVCIQKLSSNNEDQPTSFLGDALFGWRKSTSREKLSSCGNERNDVESTAWYAFKAFSRNTLCATLFINALFLFGLPFVKRSGDLANVRRAATSITKIDLTVPATSEKVFSIVQRRNYDPNLLYFQDGNNKSGLTHDSGWPKGAFWNRPDCKNWGAATTIFPPTNAVEQFVALDGWCLVVAGDRKGPAFYQLEKHGDKVVFLSQERQEELAELFAFVKKTPWNHFARKNVAYLYAIANNAQYIWDFDDNNILFPNETLSIYTKGGIRSKVLDVDTQNNTECGVFNPYPFFQPSEEGMWPRGYPLDKINAPECQLSPQYCTREVPSEKIGIYQSLADKDPDVDAVYRLTRRLPITFAGGAKDFPVLVPPDTMSPMNAQATLFSPIGFWSMFLPTTVHGRVSDIWRSYIAQTLGKQCGMLVTFVGPHVIQDRNAHTYLADMDAEKQLYERSGGLMSYLLNQWKYDGFAPTSEGAWERLFVDLYERGIIEREDVELAQLWISSLHTVGYTLPSLVPASDLFESARRREREGSNCVPWQELTNQVAPVVPAKQAVVEKRICELANVVLVGQFNYDTTAQVVMHWVKRWNEVFPHVHVRGPFNKTVMETLRDTGIQVFASVADSGFYSPMKNLADTMRLVANDTSICGVAISHDDLLLNISNLENRGFPSVDTIFAQFSSEYLSEPYFTMYPNTTFKLQHHEQLFAAEQYKDNFYTWPWWSRIMPNVIRAVSRGRGRERYARGDGGMDFYRNGQADFLYVPTSLVEQFASHAEWMVKNNIMLEVAVPTIIGRLQNEFKVPLQEAVLCTDWSKLRLNATNWLPKCFAETFGTFHPVKLSMIGSSQWDFYFDSIVLGR